MRNVYLTGAVRTPIGAFGRGAEDARSPPPSPFDNSSRRRAASSGEGRCAACASRISTISAAPNGRDAELQSWLAAGQQGARGGRRPSPALVATVLMLMAWAAQLLPLALGS